MVKLFSQNPAKLLNIYSKKGSIEVNKEADLMIWNPLDIIKVKRKNIFLKHHQVFLLKHHKFYGNVTHTFVRGNLVF